MSGGLYKRTHKHILLNLILFSCGQDSEREVLIPLTKVSVEEIKAAHKKEQEQKEAQDKLKRKIMMERGMAVDNVDLGD